MRRKPRARMGRLGLGGAPSCLMFPCSQGGALLSAVNSEPLSWPEKDNAATPGGQRRQTAAIASFLPQSKAMSRHEEHSRTPRHRGK
jgi:hypothetical protein